MSDFQTVEAGGVPLAVEESGAGAAVVLVHGIATDRSVWRETVAAAGKSPLRCIAYDRRAYGDSGAPEPYAGTTVGEQADDLAQLVRAVAGGGAVLCGHGLGALICLDVLVRFPALARAGVLIEPPMLWLSPRGTEITGELREQIARGARDGDPQGAVDAYLANVGGAAALGHDRLAAARAATHAFAADLGAAATWSGGRRALRAIDAPVLAAACTHGAPLAGEVTERLATLIPSATFERVESGHFAQVEAADVVAGLVARAAAL